MNTLSETKIYGHVTRAQTLLSEALAELDAIQMVVMCTLRGDTMPSPPPDGTETAAREDLIARIRQDAERLFSAAMAGSFHCVHCSAAGPHELVSLEGEPIMFSCSRCKGDLDEYALKCAVYARLARIAAEANGER